MEHITRAALAAMIDHTNLKADATREAIAKLCEEAAICGFRSAMVNPAQVAYCHELLKGTPVLVGSVVSFPLGQTTVEDKVAEAARAIENGAGEIDYVCNIAELKAGNADYLRQEMSAIVSLCRSKGAGVKVIFETCALTDDEKRALCRIAREVRPDFIKTSTGFGTGGATVDDVALMHAEAAGQVKVKASGGIRDLDTCLAMIAAGAERIGTSSGVKILEEYAERFGE